MYTQHTHTHTHTRPHSHAPIYMCLLPMMQSEHIGVNMFELIHEEDHADVRKKIEEAEIKSLNQKGKRQ